MPSAFPCTQKLGQNTGLKSSFPQGSTKPSWGWVFIPNPQSSPARLSSQLSASLASSKLCCKSHIVCLENFLGRKLLADTSECEKVRWNDHCCPVRKVRLRVCCQEMDLVFPLQLLLWCEWIHCHHHMEAQRGRVLEGSSCASKLGALQYLGILRSIELWVSAYRDPGDNAFWLLGPTKLNLRRNSDLLTVWPWARRLTSRCPSFSVHKIGKWY